MKTQIYLIRHGESEGNKARRFLGHTDLDLTDMGHRQAQKTAEFLKNVNADVIYSSDLIRAYNTAVHTAELKGMEIIKNRNLREIHAGDWEGRKFTEIEEIYAESFGIWHNDTGNAVCPEGESIAGLQMRIATEITKIAKENEGKTVFIFTHATPLRVFKAYCDGVGLDGIKDVPWATNASVTHVEYEDGKFSLIDYSIDYFQGEEISTIPANV